MIRLVDSSMKAAETGKMWVTVKKRLGKGKG